MKISVELFHLKWVVQDRPADYESLAPDQYINHFQNNKELTSKSFLKKNLESHYESEPPTDEFFPKSYDFSFPEDAAKFAKDYYVNCLFCILKKHVLYFRRKLGPRFCEVEAERDRLAAQMRADQGLKERIYFDKLKPGFKFVGPADQSSQYAAAVQDRAFLVNEHFLEVAIGYFLSLFRQLTSIEDQCLIFSVSKMSKAEKRLVDEFSRSPGDFDAWPADLKKKMGFNGRLEDWKTPNLNLMAQLLLFHEEFAKLGQFYGRLEDCHNLWIVKPASNARGNGIFVTDRLADILRDDRQDAVGKDTLVQKYVESPLLLELEGAEYKFDIRQWVLVTCLAPLTVYVFSGFYCRLCSNPFDLAAVGDPSRHLTNYSVNKANFREGAGQLRSSVLDDEFLKAYLRERRGFDWAAQMQPRLEAIVVEALKSAADKMKPRERSFEVYGFDILLDADLNPFLLEVNLSPACDEREPFLTAMLDDMTLGLFQLLREKELAHTKATKLLLERELAEKREREKRLEKASLAEAEVLANMGAPVLANRKKQESLEPKPQASSVLNPKALETKACLLAPTFAAADFAEPLRSCRYRWRLVHQDDASNQAVVHRPGSEAFLEVVGRPLNLKAEMAFDRRFKQR